MIQAPRVSREFSRLERLLKKGFARELRREQTFEND